MESKSIDQRLKGDLLGLSENNIQLYPIILLLYYVALKVKLFFIVICIIECVSTATYILELYF